MPKDTRGGVGGAGGGGGGTQIKYAPQSFRPETPEQKAYYDKQFSALKTQLKRYGMDLDDSLRDNLDFKGIRDSIYGVESVLKEFPEARRFLNGMKLSTDESDPDTYAYANSGSNSVHLGSGLYMNYGSVATLMKNDVSHNWHPAGSTAKSVAEHETGHLISYAVVRKMGGDLSTRSSKNKAMKKIVDKAMNSKVVKNYMKKNKLGAAQARRSISGYAATQYRNGSPNYNETIAEAVSDYMSNRSRANVLSRAIVRVMKDELRK